MLHKHCLYVVCIFFYAIHDASLLLKWNKGIIINFLGTGKYRFIVLLHLQVSATFFLCLCWINRYSYRVDSPMSRKISTPSPAWSDGNTGLEMLDLCRSHLGNWYFLLILYFGGPRKFLLSWPNLFVLSEIRRAMSFFLKI